MSVMTRWAGPLRAAARHAATTLVAAALLGGSAAAGAAAPTVVYSFGGYEGSWPWTTPVAHPDGYLYGNTYFGGIGAVDKTSGYGTIFRVKPDGSGFALLHPFNGTTEGSGPFAPMIRGLDGALYGATSAGIEGGPSANGVVFRMQTDGAFSVLHTFSGSDGGFVTGTLAQDAAGTLYGVAQRGGAANVGVLFSVQPNGSSFKVLREFGVDANGYYPRGGVALGSDGRLYGTTNAGGSTGYGTVFSVARDGTGFQVLHTFDLAKGEGTYPMSGIVQGPDGYFYSTTPEGGSNGCNCGTVFRVNAAGDFKTLYSFSDSYDGWGAFSEPVIGADGLLYGTTVNGGANVYFGTAWKMDTSGKLLGLLPFSSTTVGTAESGLAFGLDGALYGTSTGGGTGGVGTVYRIDPAELAPPQAPLPAVQIWVTPKKITAGKRAMLSWSVKDPTATTTCQPSGAWKRLPPTGNRTLVSPDAPGDYSYTLTCQNATGNVSATTTLTVTAP